MTILLGTNNRHKVAEISQLIAHEMASAEIKSLIDFPSVPTVMEDEPTLEGNALKKARSAYENTGILTLADDTGLECYYLELAPGVISARYAGERATYEDNNRKLLAALNGVPPRRRQARFRCVMAIVGDGVERIVEGKVEGRILESPRGAQGFGYDPLFVPEGWTKTYAEMTISEKNGLSHRAIALRRAIEVLRELRS